MHDPTFNSDYGHPLLEFLNSNQLDCGLSKCGPNFRFEERIGFLVDDGIITNKNKYQVTYYILRWEEGFRNLRISHSSIVPQSRHDTLSFKLGSPVYSYLPESVISPDGKWVRMEAYDVERANDWRRELYMLPQTYENVFFHIDEKYEKGISPPVFGGTAPTVNGPVGCFVSHSKLGTLWVDYDPEFPGALFVYRLEDALPIIGRKLEDR